MSVFGAGGTKVGRWPSAAEETASWEMPQILHQDAPDPPPLFSPWCIKKKKKTKKILIGG